MKQLVFRLLAAAALGNALIAGAAEKSFVDYFLPMKPRGPLVSEGIGGAPNVLPRDMHKTVARENAKAGNWAPHRKNHSLSK